LAQRRARSQIARLDAASPFSHSADGLKSPTFPFKSGTLRLRRARISPAHTPGAAMKNLMMGLAATAGVLIGGVAQAAYLNIALIYGRTGPLEAYAKQTEAGLRLGFEYATKGSMEIDGRKINIILKDDQSKPDLAKTALAEAYEDDNADIAIGTSSSAAALAMLPVAEEHKKILIVEPAVADQITGDKWNRYIFRTGRNSSQDAISEAVAFGKPGVTFATLAADYAFGHDGVAAFKEALAKTGATLAAEEYAPATTTDFTAVGQRLFDALKDKPGRKLIFIVWAGAANPLEKLSELDPGRYGIEFAAAGNTLSVLSSYKRFPGMEGAAYYYYGLPKNPINDWFVAEHQKRFNAPPDMFTAGGFSAAMAVVAAVQKAKSTDTEKLIATMEGMDFDTPKGKMVFRKEDHQALQAMYHFKVRVDPALSWAALDLVDELKIEDMTIPIRNKR
jgi:branched-chain amino acid transport system substrate-binding protein